MSRPFLFEIPYANLAAMAKKTFPPEIASVLTVLN